MKTGQHPAVLITVFNQCADAELLVLDVVATRALDERFDKSGRGGHGPQFGDVSPHVDAWVVERIEHERATGVEVQVAPIFFRRLKVGDELGALGRFGERAAVRAVAVGFRAAFPDAGVVAERGVDGDYVARLDTRAVEHFDDVEIEFERTINEVGLVFAGHVDRFDVVHRGGDRGAIFANSSDFDADSRGGCDLRAER